MKCIAKSQAAQDHLVEPFSVSGTAPFVQHGDNAVEFIVELRVPFLSHKHFICFRKDHVNPLALMLMSSALFRQALAARSTS